MSIDVGETRDKMESEYEDYEDYEEK